MPQERTRKERLVVLATVLFVFLNYPLLSLFSRDIYLFGLPLLYLYIFFLWGGAIVATFLALSRHRLPPPTSEKKGGPP